MARSAELADLTDEELRKALSEAKQELFNLRFQHATGQLENYRRPSQVKKEIARIMTKLREREIAAAEALAGGEG
ncbi:MAG: 50S ribosomal protein L29 [Actinomycetota bacterium]|nr:50S ribosomal protein L29 [Actinomycetota bacterium]